MKYISKVEILFYPVGTEFEISENGYYVASGRRGDGRPVIIPAGIVENYPNFFEPIIERWGPKEGEAFYWVSNCGDIVREEKFKPMLDSSLWVYGNCFETLDQAEGAAQTLKQTLMEFHKKLEEK